MSADLPDDAAAHSVDTSADAGAKQSIDQRVGTGKTPRAVVEVTAKDLTGPGVVFCPNPKMPLWSNHPRVFIDVATGGEGWCPYCGTVYRLRPGETLHAH